MKLIGKKLDAYMVQYDQKRKVIKGVPEDDKAFRMRVRKILKQSEEWLGYFELRVRRTEAPIGPKDKFFWSREKGGEWDQYKEFMKSMSDANGEEWDDTTPMGPHTGPQRRDAMDMNSELTRPVAHNTELEDAEERYADDFAFIFSQGPNAVKSAFEKNLRQFMKNTGRRPLRICFTKEAYDTLSPIFDRLDEFSEMREIVRGGRGVKAAGLYTVDKQGSPWQFEV